jgi:hypothetical protein
MRSETLKLHFSMKKLLFIFYSLLGFAITAMAQVPQYSLPQGTTNNVFPFGSTSSNKVQWLYVPTDFSVPPPTGSITKVYFKTWSSSYSATYTNFTIRMTQSSTLTQFTSGTYLTGLTTVYQASSQTVPTTGAYTWFSFTLQTPFPYTAGNSLILEIEQNGMSGGITANCTNGTNRRIYGTYGSGSGTLGAGMGDLGLDIQTGPPCPAPGGLAATAITSTAATLSWSAVSGSQGYEYLVDQNAVVPWPFTSTFTNGTSFNKTGLTPSTNYYLHVRNRCSPTNPSPWADLPFTTLPPCLPPVNFNVTNLTPTGGTLNWNPWPSAQNYDVILDQSNQAPTSTTGAVNTAFTSMPSGLLQENTWYYVHIRSNCAGGEQSGWSLDSFQTPIPCRPPDIKIEHVNTDEAVAYWADVPTATHYEYVLNTSPTPPSNGTEYQFNSLHVSALDDGKDYYIHVRSHCNSIGIIDASPWGTASFKTFPTSVQQVKDRIGLAAYPNPVDDVLTIEVSGNRSGAAYIVVTDVSRRQLLKQDANNAKNLVPMGNLPAGIYLIKYMDDVHNEVIRINKQ